MKPVLYCMYMFFLCFLVSSEAFGSGLFDEAAGSTESDSKAFEMGGYMKGAVYGGATDGEESESEIKTSYGEAGLKLKAKKEGGDAIAELRFKKGREGEEEISSLKVREAYVNTYSSHFDLRLGEQIVVWGRADGFNPTDNVTPKNMLVFSSDEDDRRVSNFLARAWLNFLPLRFEAIVVPTYKHSAMPIENIPISEGVTVTEGEYPDSRTKNSATAAKLSLEMSSFDGSLSYYSGPSVTPGVNLGAVTPTETGVEMTIFPKSYTMHVVGMDFSTTIAGLFGLRGEAAYKKPHEDYETNLYVPNPEKQYVVGVDKEFSGSYSIILQYITKEVEDFEELEKPEDQTLMPQYQIGTINRLISGQTEKKTDSVSLRLEGKFLHETLRFEVAGIYNTTTKELMGRPSVTYDIADALSVKAGWQRYEGPDDTLMGMIETRQSAVFVELKSSF